MRRETIRLWNDEEYGYRAACGFIPKLDAYLHEDGIVRPCMIIVPGGGYRGCYPCEGEPVALAFYKLGYQTFVCTYTTNVLGQEPLRLQPATDLARAVRRVRKKAEDYQINPQQVVVCGFSAGGHAAGTLGVHFEDLTELSPMYSGISCRPDALILAYPVISVFSQIAHMGSSERLLGKNPLQEEKEYMRLERNVTTKCPPCFIWQTVTDETVPVENSLVLAESYRKAGASFSLHLFSSGTHGLSVADGTTRTTEENAYTLEPARCVLAALQNGSLILSEEDEKNLMTSPEVRFIEKEIEEMSLSRYQPEVQSWVGLANDWMCNLWTAKTQ